MMRMAESAFQDLAFGSSSGYNVALPAIDRTPKMFIGGKQVRPDSGYSRDIYDPEGHMIGQVGEGNRKDIRNAVEAAHAASGWAVGTTHNRAQILYYIAENLSIREENLLAGSCSRPVGPMQMLSLKFSRASRDCSAMRPGRINMRGSYIVHRCVA